MILKRRRDACSTYRLNSVREPQLDFWNSGILIGRSSCQSCIWSCSSRTIVIVARFFVIARSLSTNLQLSIFVRFPCPSINVSIAHRWMSLHSFCMIFIFMRVHETLLNQTTVNDAVSTSMTRTTTTDHLDRISKTQSQTRTTRLDWRERESFLCGSREWLR